MLTTDRDAGRINLRIARISEESAFLVSAPRCGHVATFGIGRKEEDVSIAARRQDDSIRSMRSDFAVDEIARHNSFGMSVDHDELQHVSARKHLHCAQRNLPAKRLISAEEQLLAGLTARVKSARDLRATKRAIRQQTPVLAGEGDALGDALVDDVYADLREAIDIGLACPKIATFDRVVKEPVNAVAVVLIVLRGVDAALSGD